MARLHACHATSHAQVCYYGVEANPRWTAVLQKTAARARRRGQRVHVFVPTALDVADGEASFFVESNGHSPGLDATLESARSVHYKDESGWHRDPEAPVGESGAFRSVTVRTMAIGAFFSQLVAASGEKVAAALRKDGK